MARYYGGSQGDFLRNPPVCEFTGQTYYSPSNYFRHVYGFSSEFAYSAVATIQSVIKPMDRIDNQRLYFELQNKENGIGPLLSIGASKGRFTEGQYYLFFASAFTVLVGVSAFMNKLFKNVKVPIKKDLKSRAKMFPLLISHIPLMIVTLLTVFAFTETLWPSYETRHAENEASIAIEHINAKESFLACNAKREFDLLVVNGKTTMEHLLLELTKNVTMDCRIEDELRTHLTLINHDADAVDETIEAAEHLLAQMGIAKKQGLFKEPKDINEFNYAQMMVNKSLLEMKILRKAMDSTVYMNYAKVLNGILIERQVFEDKIKHYVTEAKIKLDHTEEGFTKVDRSLDNAQKAIASWIRTYAERMKAVKDDVLSGKNPLYYYIAVQILICVCCFFSITGLCLGFGTFIIGLVYPSAFKIWPAFISLMRKYLFFVFTVLGLCAIIVFLLSGIALRFVAPTTSLCKSLTSFHYDNSSSEGLRFYTDNHIVFNVTTFNGRTHVINMGEYLRSVRTSTLATKYGNGREDLIPARIVDNVMEHLVNRIEEIDGLEIKDILIEDYTRFSRPLAKTRVALEEADLASSPAIQSQFVGLIGKELRTFKRLMAGLDLKSLKEVTMSGCKTTISLDPTLKNKLIRSYDSSFAAYKQQLESNLYQTYSHVYAYQGASSEFCIQWRYSAAAAWLAALLLGTVMTLNMTVIYKVSNRLYLEDYQNFVPETDNGDRNTPSVALLVDDAKSIDSSVCDA